MVLVERDNHISEIMLHLAYRTYQRLHGRYVRK